MLVNCNCADELHLRLMADAKLHSGAVVLGNLKGIKSYLSEQRLLVLGKVNLIRFLNLIILRWLT